MPRVQQASKQKRTTKAAINGTLQSIGDIAQGLGPVGVVDFVQPRRQPFFDAVEII